MSIYFARESKHGLIKIGTSINPKDRIKSIPSQNGNRFGKMELMMVVDGSYEEEKFFKQLFKRSRFDPSFSQEWFYPTREVMSTIEAGPVAAKEEVEEWKRAS